MLLIRLFNNQELLLRFPSVSISIFTASWMPVLRMILNIFEHKFFWYVLLLIFIISNFRYLFIVMLVHQMYLRKQFLRSTSSEFPTFVQFSAGELTISPLGVVMMGGRVGGSERYYRLISLILSSIDNRSSNEERFPSPWRAYSCTTWRCVEGEGYYWRASLSCAVFRRKANLVRVMCRSAISLRKCDS